MEEAVSTINPVFDKRSELRWLRIVAWSISLLIAAPVCYMWPIMLVPALIALCVWSIFNFTLAMFIMAATAMAQGKLGFLWSTPGHVIVANVYILEVYLPFFFLSFAIDRFRAGGRGVEFVWHRNIREIIVVSGGFIAWALVCTTITEWTIRAYLQFMHAFVFFVYFVFISAFSWKELRRLMAILFFFGAIFSVAALLSVSGFSFGWNPIDITKELSVQIGFFEAKKRACIISPPSVTAVNLGLFAWCGYAIFLMRSKGKFWMFLLAFWVSVGVFLTRTRSEMVGFLGAVTVAITFLSWRKKFVMTGVVIGIFYVVLVWLASAGADLADQLTRLKAAADTGEKASLGVRLELWKGGLIDTFTNYGLGEGTGGFFKYRDQWPHAHDNYLSVLFDLGVIGMAIWLMMYFCIVRLLLHTFKITPETSPEWFLLVCFMAFFTELLLTALLQDEYVTFIWWLFPGMLLAALNHCLKKFGSERTDQLQADETCA